MSASTSKATSTDALPNSSDATNASRPDGTLSADGRFQWIAVWGAWVPTGKEETLDLPGPLEFGPLLPERHSESCLCVECWNAGVRYADYLKSKRVRNRNGF